MKISTSSLMLASLAFTGSALAAPTPKTPFDSPVPNSPVPDEFSESVRSPRIPRSPMVPAVRVAGRRRSLPRIKRQDGQTASASGLLSGVGDALSGLLNQAGDIAHSLPVAGGLGILSTDGSNAPSKRDTPEAPSPPLSTVSAPNAEALRQMLLKALIQQQQADQAAAALNAASAGLPVDPVALQQRLEQVAAAGGQGDLPTSATTLNALDLSGLVGGLPIAGPLASTLLNGNTLSGLTGLASGPLSTVGSVAGGLPIVGGLLGGLPNTASGLLNGVAGSADGLLGSVLGQASNNMQQNSLPDSLSPQAFSSQTQNSPWAGPDGLYHHTLEGAPIVPQNSLVDNPFPMLNVDGSSLPLVPPPSPASSAVSVPMGHSASGVDIPSAASVFLSSEGIEDASPSSSTPLPGSTNVARAIERDEVDIHGVHETDMHEGGVDAAPGPQDVLSGTKTAPRFSKMIRRRLRGFSVAF